MSQVTDELKQLKLQLASTTSSDIIIDEKIVSTFLCQKSGNVSNHNYLISTSTTKREISQTNTEEFEVNDKDSLVALLENKFIERQRKENELNNLNEEIERLKDMLNQSKSK